MKHPNVAPKGLIVLKRAMYDDSFSGVHPNLTLNVLILGLKTHIP
jgi:hypothetical protein